MKNKIALNYFQLSSSEEISSNEDVVPVEFKILPTSPVVGRDGREFTYDANQLLSAFIKNEQDIVIDENHESETIYSGKAEALGWISSLNIKEDGIYANCEWTYKGKHLLEDKLYKYVSPAFYINSKNEIDLLTSVALTNQPNLKLPALNNKVDRKEQGKYEIIELNNIINKKEKAIMNEDKRLNLVLNSLGLSFDASENEIKESVKTLNTKNNELETKNLELNNKLSEKDIELNKIKLEHFTKAKHSAIKHAISLNKILPNQENYFSDSIKTDTELDNFNKMSEAMPAILGEALSKPNIDFSVEALNEEQKELCAREGISAEEFVKVKNKIFSV